MDLQTIKQDKVRNIQIAISIISIIATTGSLYLSLGLGLIPCELCWYQRILMYPIIPISIYSIYKKQTFAPLILTFSILGMTISYYHSFIQIAPNANVCSTACGAILYTFGPLSIPNLSAIAFTLITVLTIFAYHQKQNQ